MDQDIVLKSEWSHHGHWRCNTDGRHCAKHCEMNSSACASTAQQAPVMHCDLDCGAFTHRKINTNKQHTLGTGGVQWHHELLDLWPSRHVDSPRILHPLIYPLMHPHIHECLHLPAPTLTRMRACMNAYTHECMHACIWGATPQHCSTAAPQHRSTAACKWELRSSTRQLPRRQANGGGWGGGAPE